MKPKINFKKNKYDADLIIGTFGLKRNQGCTDLQHWLAVNGEIEEQQHEYLEKHRQKLLHEGEYWNEEELKMHFLSHIFFLADIDIPEKLKLFYERTLQETIAQQDIFVKCDCLIATPFGINTPQVPYFFLQEFKRAKKPDDPEGQMLLAMLCAQHKNEDGQPIYGCYLQGKDWKFTTLTAKNYCVSKTFDATEWDELQQIILILRQLKTLILKRLL